MTLDARGRSAAAALRQAAHTDVEVQAMLDQVPRDSRRKRALASRGPPHRRGTDRVRGMGGPPPASDRLGEPWDHHPHRGTVGITGRRLHHHALRGPVHRCGA